MTQPTLVLRVKFKSALPLDEVRAVADSRADDFRALPGLVQKYYLVNEDTGEIAGLYFWESRQDFDHYMQSELRASIAAAYKAVAPPEIEMYSIIKTLRETGA